MNYDEHPKLSNYYLEDSYILDIIETDRSLAFYIEAAVSESHPNYISPPDDRPYNYTNISIIFSGVKSIEWQVKNMMHFTDKANEIDYGNIDSLIILENSYILSGDWGRVIIIGGSMTITPSAPDQ